MLLLTTTTDKLRLITSAAATVDVHASWADNASGAITLGRTNTAITTATTTDIVAAPAASTVRNIKTLHIRNKHASTSVDVTVVFDQNGTAFQLCSFTLRAGEALEYIEGVGFFPQLAATNPVLRAFALTADQSNSTTTPTEVTDLSQTTGTGVFEFEYSILYQSTATGTGVRFSVNHTGTVSAFVAWWYFVDTSATAATAAADQDAIGAAGQVFSAFAARAKSTAGWGTSISVDTANADMLAVVRGKAIVTADGDLELWHGSETAVQTTVKAGSSLILTRTGD